MYNVPLELEGVKRVTLQSGSLAPSISKGKARGKVV